MNELATPTDRRYESQTGGHRGLRLMGYCGLVLGVTALGCGARMEPPPAPVPAKPSPPPAPVETPKAPPSEDPPDRNLPLPPPDDTRCCEDDNTCERETDPCVLGLKGELALDEDTLRECRRLAKLKGFEEKQYLRDTYAPYENCPLRLPKMTKRRSLEIRSRYEPAVVMGDDADAAFTELSDGALLMAVDLCRQRRTGSSPTLMEGNALPQFLLLSDEQDVQRLEVAPGLPEMGYVRFSCDADWRCRHPMSAPCREMDAGHLFRNITRIAGRSKDDFFVVVTQRLPGKPIGKGDVVFDDLYRYEDGRWSRWPVPPPELPEETWQIRGPNGDRPLVQYRFVTPRLDAVVFLRETVIPGEAARRELVLLDGTSEPVLSLLPESSRLLALSAFPSGEVVAVGEMGTSLFLKRFGSKDHPLQRFTFPFDGCRDSLRVSAEGPERITVTTKTGTTRAYVRSGDRYERECLESVPEPDEERAPESIEVLQSFENQQYKLSERSGYGEHAEHRAGDRRFFSFLCRREDRHIGRCLYTDTPVREPFEISSTCGFVDQTYCDESTACEWFQMCTFRDGQCVRADAPSE